MILFLTDHDRDYAADYLYDGFASLLHPEQVIDFPSKPSLHLPEGTPQLFDCDFCHPELHQRWTEADVEEVLGARRFDLIVVPTLRGQVPMRLVKWRALLDKNADRLVYVDGEDHANNTLPAFVDLTRCRPRAFFKRELPIGEPWGFPLPFGYPAARVTWREDDERRVLAMYAVQVWGWAKGGLRERLGELIHRQLGRRAYVRMAEGGDDRLSIADYHRLQRRASIAISPAGQGWHTNRHLEIVADGCAPVLERPWREFPGAFTEGVEAEYFRDEFEAVEKTEELLDDPARATQMAKAAQVALLERHTTAIRAQTVLRVATGE
jgi:hypothetical protein